ncbi:TIR domain-containing protein [Actinospica robiniae]|uniref:WD40 domain-containing protein n=1 Tax=Actinospica robiniae TaxID=304901 RepID=UPI0004151ED9|nr:TIR domain-containing protein [Actinospica robiniae]
MAEQTDDQRYPLNDDFGKRISALRTERGWSQQALADRIAREHPEMSIARRSTIGKIESGVRVFLRVQEAEALARVFGVGLAEFAGAASGPTAVLPATPGPLLFISYAVADRVWAEWIAHQLEEAGYRITMQGRDFVPGANFVELIDRGLTQASVVVCVLSKAYQVSEFGRREWQAVYASRTHGEGGRSRLLPVRVEDIPVDGLLASLTYVDLAHVPDQDAARSLLLAQVNDSMAGRAVPAQRPQYPGAPAAVGVAIPAQALEPDYPPEQRRNLLVQEVIKTRHPGARVFQVPGQFPHLLVSYNEGEVVEQVRIGTHVGQVDEQVLDDFATQVRDADPLTKAELVYQGPPPAEAVQEESVRRRVRLRSIDDFRGLIDLRPFVQRQTERLCADTDYAPRHYVPQRFRDLSANATTVRGDLAEHLVSELGKDVGGFTLVLGDFGAGKTFALREVAQRLSAFPELVPLYIELRSLDKAHSVEGLVSSHLANFRHRQIDLDVFQNLLRAGRIVLLFDGFDELVTRVTYDRAADHLRRLIATAEGKAKIVVASRTQHFKSAQQVLTALGEQVGLGSRRRMLSIEPFDTDQIRSYLTRHYDNDASRAQDRIDAMSRVNDLTALSVNPRMLGFIAALDDAQLKAAAIAPVLSGATLYEQVLDHWLAYEVERTSGVAGAPPGLTHQQLWRAVSVLALRLWESGESQLSMDELGEIGHSLAQLADFRLSPEQTVHAVGAGSLLVRSDDDRFGFIHGSVMEWLLAKRIADEWNAGVTEPQLLLMRPLSETALEFLCDLAGTRNALDWVSTVLDDREADSARRTNAVHLSSRLKVGTGADLRDAQLRGQDLSAMRLRSARLSGSNLDDCLLVRTDLTGADLTNARLRGAKLNDAKLTGADLTGADLSWARLVGADLTRTRIDGVDWHRSALIAVRGLEGLENRDETPLRAAAVAPGDRVEVAVGVSRTALRHGFTEGQLPRPVSFNPRGDLLAIGTAEGAVLLCDAGTGKPVRTLLGHSGPAYLVRFGSDHNTLYTGSRDGAVRTWDPDSGRERLVMGEHQDWVWPVVPNRGGTILLVGDSSGTIRLWDPRVGTVLHRLPGHSERIWTAEFHPSGDMVAVGDQSGTVRLWNPHTGKLVRELTPAEPGGSVYRVFFNSAGTLLASAHEEGKVRLWDPATGEQVVGPFEHEGRVYSLHFDRSGRYLASGDTEGQVFLRDLSTDPVRAVTLPRHRGAVYRVGFNPQGNTLATADSDGVVRLFEIPSGRLLHEIQAHRASVWPIAFHPYRNHFASSSSDGETKIWDVGSGERVHLLRGHGRTTAMARFNQNASLLAACGNDGSVRLWEPSTGQMVQQLRLEDEPFTDALFTPGFPVLAAVGQSGRVHLWGESGEYLRELFVQTKRVWSIGFSPDGDILATANDDNSVKLWYRTTNRLIHTLADHEGRVRSLDFSADGALLATGCEDGKVRIWDVATGRLLDRADLPVYSRRVYAVDWALSGGLLASASLDGNAQLWDPATQTSVLIPGAAGAKPIRTCALHPDGSLLAVSGADTNIHLWEVGAPGGPRHAAMLRGHTGVVNRLSFSRDGGMMASAADDGNVRLWTVPPIDRVHEARARSTLIGLPHGWAAVAPDGRYKAAGDIAGELWHLVGMCRFELGELDGYLDQVRQVALDAEL